MAAGLDAGSFRQPQGQNLWCGMSVRENSSCVCDEKFVSCVCDLLIMEEPHVSFRFVLERRGIISSSWNDLALANFPKGV